MKISYDKDADALSIIVKKGTVFRDIEIANNIFAGFSKNDELIEIQFLDLDDADKPWITVEAMAKITDKSERTILRWIEQGKIKSKKIGNKHHIDPEEIDRLVS